VSHKQLNLTLGWQSGRGLGSVLSISYRKSNGF
jgi:hypothetical protein